jgi:hypothetical protein
MKVYVVTEPKSIAGIYDTWEECKARVSGVAGARYMAVTSREKAEAMLDGRGVPLPPGRYAFTDGNAAGGIGIVLVDQGASGSPSVREISTSVQGVFSDELVPSLGSPQEVADALAALHNILAEMAAAYHVLILAEPGTSFTVVHDYKGVAEWLEGRWKARSPVIRAVVEASRGLIEDRSLDVTFQHQKGHMSTWAGRDDFAFFNARADGRATEGASGPLVS